MKQINPIDFTLPEINSIVSKANFSKDELKLFSLRNEEKSLEECAEVMDMSVRNVSRINKKMKDKILKVL